MDTAKERMLPLDGIKVIAIEQAVAAPLASRHLADFGARVIKIERPGSGDFARGYDTAVRGMSSWFVWLNRSKESLTLDLKHAEATTIVNRLIAESDVLLTISLRGPLSAWDWAARRWWNNIHG